MALVEALSRSQALLLCSLDLRIHFLQKPQNHHLTTKKRHLPEPPTLTPQKAAAEQLPEPRRRLDGLSAVAGGVHVEELGRSATDGERRISQGVGHGVEVLRKRLVEILNEQRAQSPPCRNAAKKQSRSFTDGNNRHKTPKYPNPRLKTTKTT